MLSCSDLTEDHRYYSDWIRSHTRNAYGLDGSPAYPNTLFGGGGGCVSGIHLLPRQLAVGQPRGHPLVAPQGGHAPQLPPRGCPQLLGNGRPRLCGFHRGVQFCIGCCSEGIEVYNLSLRWDQLDQFEGSPDTQEYAQRWRDWLFSEVDRLSGDTDGRWRPVMIDLDPPYNVTRGGQVLCRRITGEYLVGGPASAQVSESTGVVTFGRYGTEYGEFSNTAPYPTKIRQPDVAFSSNTTCGLSDSLPKRTESGFARPTSYSRRDWRVTLSRNCTRLGVDHCKFLRVALMAKFTQLEDLRDLLLSTDAAELLDRTDYSQSGDATTVARRTCSAHPHGGSGSLAATPDAEPLSWPPNFKDKDKMSWRNHIRYVDVRDHCGERDNCLSAKVGRGRMEVGP